MKVLLRFPNLWFMILLIETAARVFMHHLLCFFQIWTSVLLITISVTKMPFARTQRVLTPAVVRQDIQGMGKIVEVSDLVFS